MWWHSCTRPGHIISLVSIIILSGFISISPNFPLNFLLSSNHPFSSPLSLFLHTETHQQRRPLLWLDIQRTHFGRKLLLSALFVLGTPSLRAGSSIVMVHTKSCTPWAVGYSSRQICCWSNRSSSTLNSSSSNKPLCVCVCLYVAKQFWAIV